MPILFFLAGASTRFALGSRSAKKYIIERVRRLLIPFILGMLILVPPQGYLARISRGRPVGNYFQQYKYFWTTISNIPYDGGFGPAHLWFILYLFIIAIVGLFIIRSFRKKIMEKFLLRLKDKLTGKYSLIFAVLILFITDMAPIEIAGKNILIFLIIYLMGYIVYDDNDYLEYINKKKKQSLIILVIFFVFYIGVILYYYNLDNNGGVGLEVLVSLMRNGIMVTAIVVIVGYGRKYLTKGGKALDYLNKACFPIYILHQPIIVVIAYYLVSNLKLPMYLSILIILVSSVPITFGIYELLRRIKIMKYLIGVK